jgi:hypothetical protein
MTILRDRVDDSKYQVRARDERGEKQTFVEEGRWLRAPLRLRRRAAPVDVPYVTLHGRLLPLHRAVQREIAVGVTSPRNPLAYLDA